jgi:predicted permease
LFVVCMRREQSKTRCNSHKITTLDFFAPTQLSLVMCTSSTQSDQILKHATFQYVFFFNNVFVSRMYTQMIRNNYLSLSITWLKEKWLHLG